MEKKDKFAIWITNIMKKTPGDVDFHDEISGPDVNVKTLSYIDDNNPFHEMNVYYPKGDLKRWPLVIDVHGGAWMLGDKDLNHAINSYVASKGFYVVSFSYRLMPDVYLYEMLKDVHDAISFILTKPFDYDDNNIFIKGDSAGTHLLTVDMIINDNDDILKVFNFNKNNIKYNGIILNHPALDTNCPTNTKFKRQEANIFKRILYGRKYKSYPYYNYYSIDDFSKYYKNKAPVMVISSASDTVVGFQLPKVIKMLSDNNIKYIQYFEEKEGCKHVFNISNITTEEAIKCNEKMMEFIKDNIV